MIGKPLDAADYPVAETRPETVKGARGRSLDDLTLDAVVNGDVTMEDMRITPEALLVQAQIAQSVDRTSLAENFERAAEMTSISQEDVIKIYELLRPGRAASGDELLTAAKYLEENYDAKRLASFLREAAEVYERRGLFQVRF